MHVMMLGCCTSAHSVLRQIEPCSSTCSAHGLPRTQTSLSP